MQDLPVAEHVEQAQGIVRHQSRRLRRNVFGLLGFVLVVSVLAGLLGIRLVAAQHAVAHAPTAEPAASAATSAAGTSYVLIGHVAPDFVLETWNTTPARSVHLTALRGKPIVVNFWASWCYPCQQESKVLEAGSLRFQPQGVVFLGVALNTPSADGQQFLHTYGITYPAGKASNTEIPVQYSLVALPQTVFINSQGRVVGRYMGQISESALAKNIQAILKQ